MSDLEILEDPRAPNGLVWKGLDPGTHVWAPVGSSMRPCRIQMRPGLILEVHARHGALRVCGEDQP